MDDAGVATALEDDWEGIAREFLQKSKADDEATKAKKIVTQTYRQKSHEFICCLDNWLVVQRGVGLRHYQTKRFLTKVPKVHSLTLPPPEEPADLDWLWLVTDKCSSNCTPVCYMVNELGLRLAWSGDPNHDMWNEVKAGLRDAGFGDLIRSLIVVGNAMYGPWDSAAFFSKTEAAALEYRKRSSVNCPIFRFLLERIAQDIVRYHLRSARAILSWCCVPSCTHARRIVRALKIHMCS